ncbi:unnamed protein product [Bursaphelenchus okinawaensis]|uniref:Uncharacterized protein n=1 Tax=Bursaphelenchus okinawaensis TaxID=465554 RepID=A0A811LV95_9BILA|nr:unnamed protein product [Bursaphelenchus okinawaensis]CAG9127863.1 unnamed protein product [Bursaphelenchus okinawaensis]
MILVVGLLFLGLTVADAQLSCVYCHKGEDDIDVANLYRFMSYDSYYYKENSNEECGKENATNLKFISCYGQCAYATLFNTETNYTAIATGCYDETAPPSPIIIEDRGVTKELNIYSCSENECNAALESAQENRTRTMTPRPTTPAPPTQAPTTFRVPISGEGEKSSEELLVNITTVEPSASFGTNSFTLFNFIFPLITLSFLF